MAKWLVSLDGVLTLSALALLAFVGYSLMEMRYYLAKWIPGDTAAMIEAIVLVLIVAGWIRALFLAARGSRGGLMALTGLSVMGILIAVYDLQYVFGPIS